MPILSLNALCDKLCATPTFKKKVKLATTAQTCKTTFKMISNADKTIYY